MSDNIDSLLASIGIPTVPTTAPVTAPPWAQELSEEVIRLVKIHEDLEKFVYQSQLKNQDPRQQRLILREKELLKELIAVMKGRLSLVLNAKPK